MYSGKKFYKIVFGFNGDLNYFPITADELHKAYVLAMEGGKAIFETGFFNNRQNDILRIEPDWHRVKGWNKGHKMQAEDFEDVAPLQQEFQKTLYNGKLLAEYIVKENRRDLLEKPASVSFKEIKQLSQKVENKQISQESKSLADKLKIE